MKKANFNLHIRYISFICVLLVLTALSLVFSDRMQKSANMQSINEGGRLLGVLSYNLEQIKYDLTKIDFYSQSEDIKEIRLEMQNRCSYIIGATSFCDDFTSIYMEPFLIQVSSVEGHATSEINAYVDKIEKVCDLLSSTDDIKEVSGKLDLILSPVIDKK